MDHAPESPSKYMTTIDHFFGIKKYIFRFFLSKKIMKICSKPHQIAPFKIFFRGSMSPTSPNKSLATPRVVKVEYHPWQILYTPMDYY